MTNNALERHNSEVYELLGRHPHPNPYYFMTCIRSALQTNQKLLAWVENGDHVEVRSRDAKTSALKRQRLKVQFLDRLKRARNEHDTRRARLRYMICTGRTGAKIAKGRKQRKAKSLKKTQNRRQSNHPNDWEDRHTQEKKLLNKRNADTVESCWLVKLDARITKEFVRKRNWMKVKVVVSTARKLIK